MILRENGVETVESCQGGAGHAFPEPTIKFSGGKKKATERCSASDNLRVMNCVVSGRSTMSQPVHIGT